MPGQRALAASVEEIVLRRRGMHLPHEPIDDSMSFLHFIHMTVGKRGFAVRGVQWGLALGP